MANLRIVIAGSGSMETSIAEIFAEYEHIVTIFDTDRESLKKSRSAVKNSQLEKVMCGDLSMSQSENLVNRIFYSCEKDCFSCCDLVIESVSDQLVEKQKFCKDISKLMPEKAILTTNTSEFSVGEIGKDVCRPERFCGMHWFDPPFLVPVVEIIKGDKSSINTCEYVYNLALDLNRKPIFVKKDIAGFIGTRLELSLMREALKIVEDGLGDFKDVDKMVKFFLTCKYIGNGPFELWDIDGLDRFYSMAQLIYPHLSCEGRPDGILKERIEKGSFGISTREGFYSYTDNEVRSAVKNRRNFCQELNAFINIR